MAELENREVFIPEAVRRAAARAEELSQAMYGEQHTPSAPNPTNGGEAPPVVVEPQVVTPQPQPGASDWEQRYRTLQGKYDSEIPQLRNQVSSLENLVRTMQAPASAPAASVASSSRPQATIPQEDIEAYGPELIEAHHRWTGAYVQPQLDDMRRELDHLKGGQEQITVNVMHDRVHDGLDGDPELASVWRNMNGDQGFLGWLHQPDPMSGQHRMTMLQAAYDSGDAMRASRFFKAYIAEHTGGSTYSPPPPPQTAPAQPYSNGNGHAPAPAGGPRLEDYVAPGRPSGSTNNGNGAPEKKMWTNPEIAKFFDDRRRGRYHGREAEGLQIEADIFAAANEGRVVQR